MSQFFKTREETEAWLNKMGVKDYTINDDLTVAVANHVSFLNVKIPQLPVQFSSVDGDFLIDDVWLESLKGCPRTVYGDFDCSGNPLASLEGGPQTVNGNYRCCNTLISELSGGPDLVKGDFDCSSCHLTSLKSAPSVVGKGFYCGHNNLSSLKEGPSLVGDNYDCEGNENLMSLEGMPTKITGSVYASETGISSLKGAPETIQFSLFCNQCSQLRSFEGLPKHIGVKFTTNGTAFDDPEFLYDEVKSLVESGKEFYVRNWSAVIEKIRAEKVFESMKDKFDSESTTPQAIRRNRPARS